MDFWENIHPWAQASAMIFLPFLNKINLDFNLGENRTSAAAGGIEPFLVLVLVAIVTTLACYYLPEITNHHSIDTLDDLMFIEKTNRCEQVYDTEDKKN